MSASRIQDREVVLSLQPFVLRRRVTWGECDAAGVVYTPRFGDFTADTSQLFLGHVLGQDGFMRGKEHHGIGTPCKALSFVFHSSLRPDECVDMQVRVARIGGTTFELLVRGTTTGGAAVFDSNTNSEASDESYVLLSVSIEKVTSSCRRLEPQWVLQHRRRVSQVPLPSPAVSSTDVETAVPAT